MKTMKDRTKVIILSTLIFAILISTSTVEINLTATTPIDENLTTVLTPKGEPQFIYEFVGEYKQDFSYNRAGVCAVDNYAYLCSSSGGLEIINVTDPSNPDKVGTHYDGGNAADVYVEGDIAFLADYNDGLEIIDISDKTNPVEIGSVTQTGHSQCIDVQGNFAFIADGWKGFMIVNITDLTNPTIIGTYDDGDSLLNRN